MPGNELWKEIPPPCAPLVRAGHSMCVLSARRFAVFGGVDSHPVTEQTKYAWSFDVYDIVDRWQRVEVEGAALAPRYGHTLTSIGEEIFVYGGRIKREGGGLLHVGSMDVVKLTSARQAVNQHLPQATTDREFRGSPPPRAGHSCVAFEGKLFVLGGTLDPGVVEPPNVVWVYNPVKFKWARVLTTGEAPPSLAWHSAVVAGTSMLVFGGLVTGAEPRYSNQLVKLNMKTFQWSLVSAVVESKLGLPALAYHSAELLRGDAEAGGLMVMLQCISLYVVFVLMVYREKSRRILPGSLIRQMVTGGLLSDRGINTDIWYYEVAGQKWDKLPNPPPCVARWKHGTAILGSPPALYVFGGHKGNPRAEIPAHSDLWEVALVQGPAAEPDSVLVDDLRRLYSLLTSCQRFLQQDTLKEIASMQARLAAPALQELQAVNLETLSVDELRELEEKVLDLHQAIRSRRRRLG